MTRVRGMKMEGSERMDMGRYILEVGVTFVMLLVDFG